LGRVSGGVFNRWAVVFNGTSLLRIAPLFLTADPCMPDALDGMWVFGVAGL